MYDRRLPQRDNMVRRYTGVHDAWVQNVHMQRGGNRELATAECVSRLFTPSLAWSRLTRFGARRSLGGQVCLWDIRLTEPIQTLQAHQGGLTQMTVHEHAPIFATRVSPSRFPPPFEPWLTLARTCRSSAYNVVKLWNMNDLSEPFSKFRNTCASALACLLLHHRWLAR